MSERQRTDFQWAKVEGRLDSMVASSTGQEAYMASQGSLPAAVERYVKLLESSDDGIVRSIGACIDWKRTWQEGDFDRLAMANALARVALQDSSLWVSSWKLDDPESPEELEIELPADTAGFSFEGERRHLVFDSLQVRLLQD